VSASIASAAVAPNEGGILIIRKVGMGVGGGLTLGVVLAVLDPLIIAVGVALSIVVVGLRLVGFIVATMLVVGLRVGVDNFAEAVVLLKVGVGVTVTTPVGLVWSEARLFGGVVVRSIVNNNRTTLVIRVTLRTGPRVGPRSLLLEISFSHPFKFIYPLVLLC
jgi:hypothetical protein